MQRKVLITGGAGFIGSHVADELLAAGHRVRALDSLDEQVHGGEQARPEYLHADVELVIGDVRDPASVRRALDGIDAVVHLAAAVGVGQSMYEIEHYVSANDGGTAVLLEELSEQPVRKLVVASSMSIYGEGLYRDASGAALHDAERRIEDVKAGRWEIFDAQGRVLEPVATPETKTPALSSVYALTKFDQERLCLIIGRARGLPTTALRFFNVYGPRQALSNPYTGVLAIFAARLLNGRPPLIYEDGFQRRDFVSVYDVARAVRLALESEAADGQVLNIGSGQSRTIREVAECLAAVLGKPELRPEITGRFRIGDVRHCFANISAARAVLGYEPQMDFERGLAELADWLRDRTAVDGAETANAELAARGLTICQAN